MENTQSIIPSQSSHMNALKKIITVKLCLKKRVACQKRFHVTFWSLTAIQSAVTLDLMCSDWQKSQSRGEGDMFIFKSFTHAIKKKGGKNSVGVVVASIKRMGITKNIYIYKKTKKPQDKLK